MLLGSWNSQQLSLFVVRLIQQELRGDNNPTRQQLPNACMGVRRATLTNVEMRNGPRAVTVISVWAGEGPALLRDQDKHRSALCCSGADACLWGTLSDRPTLPGQRRTHTVVTFNKEERKRNASHVRRENET